MYRVRQPGEALLRRAFLRIVVACSRRKDIGLARSPDLLTVEHGSMYLRVCAYLRPWFPGLRFLWHLAVFGYRMEVGGAWRSPVAHLLWEQGVAGSNPVAPTGCDGSKWPSSKGQARRDPRQIAPVAQLDRAPAF